jgi:rhamnulokinase
LIRTALDSLALKYAVVIRQLEELSGETLEAIHIVGGGSQNALLNQLTANACRRPVFAGPAEATVMGNLLMQALAAKELGSLGEIREVSRRSSTLTQYEPEPDDSGRWAAGRERLAGLLPRRI